MQLIYFLLSSISTISLASFATAKDITGHATIRVNNLSTGQTVGCLNSSGKWTDVAPAACPKFTTKTGRSRKRKDTTTIVSSDDALCGFARATVGEVFQCGGTLVRTSTWSLKSDVLATDPEGREFTAPTIPSNVTTEVTFGAGVDGPVTLTLSWVN